MLQAATTANTEMGAKRAYAMRRRNNDTFYPALCEIPFNQGIYKIDRFAGQAAINEHGFAFHMRDSAQVMGEGFDLGFGGGFGQFSTVGAFGHEDIQLVKEKGLKAYSMLTQSMALLDMPTHQFDGNAIVPRNTKFNCP
jgi:hypothetical protein